MDKTMAALFEGLGNLAATFQANPVGACLLVVLAGVAVAGLRVWRQHEAERAERRPPA